MPPLQKRAWVGPAIVPATLVLGGGERKNVDERDRAILARAPMFQQVAILLEQKRADQSLCRTLAGSTASARRTGT